MLFHAVISTTLIAPLAGGFIVLCFLVSFALSRSSGLMGLRLKSIKDPVDGTLHVVSASIPPWNASSSNYSLTGVIQAPGLPATTVKRGGLASTSKWPQPGQDLPVTVSRANPSKFIIRWDEVDSSSAQGTRLADQLAESINQGQAGGSGLNSSSVVIDARNDPEVRQQVLGMLKGQGVDVDQLRPAAAGGLAASSGSAVGDDVELLEKLSQLREKGALTDQEYAEQKAKILGSGA
ncbi:MAG: SHOCT domain-containing protein [Solirubrobacteraceae bacterium]